MGRTVTKRDAEKLLGKDIVAYKKDGSIVTGKLVKISGNRLYVRQKSGKKCIPKRLLRSFCLICWLSAHRPLLSVALVPLGLAASAPLGLVAHSFGKPA